MKFSGFHFHTAPFGIQSLIPGAGDASGSIQEHVLVDDAEAILFDLLHSRWRRLALDITLGIWIRRSRLRSQTRSNVANSRSPNTVRNSCQQLLIVQDRRCFAYCC